ncbi:MAG: TlyA family RNA methyltransferase [Thermotogae bacterium]|jgi:23S rRNA (cytidine1920-2'-O)/16S rRNA (cytidine1409-2'-O)-methyltransferase|nr:TlyA family RNA methyltransferase [Thermotogota bacterium]MCL5032980.1 TlyA family RNA methyltransferase [Thermotogota bacterium]
MKKRVDEVLVSRGLFPSRNRAREEVLFGRIKVNGKMVSKAGKLIEENSKIEVDGKTYVSRGSYKLLKGLDEFKIDLTGKVCCDLGSSTGGFTQVMIERGAIRVYAIDVGSGELKIKDPRIVLMEKTNARFLKRRDFELPINFVSCDLSFISLKHILPVINEILDECGISVCLVKPQFETGARVKSGIVRSKHTHVEILKEMLRFAQSEGFKIGGLTFSPIKGGSGNIEFLMELNKNFTGSFDVERVVNSAWIELEG